MFDKFERDDSYHTPAVAAAACSSCSEHRYRTIYPFARLHSVMCELNKTILFVPGNEVAAPGDQTFEILYKSILLQEFVACFNSHRLSQFF